MTRHVVPKKSNNGTCLKKEIHPSQKKCVKNNYVKHLVSSAIIHSSLVARKSPALEPSLVGDEYLHNSPCVCAKLPFFFISL